MEIEKLLLLIQIKVDGHDFNKWKYTKLLMLLMRLWRKNELSEQRNKPVCLQHFLLLSQFLFLLKGRKIDNC